MEYYAAGQNEKARMFDNVIVGVGEHESWHDAIALAKRLVSADGRLTLANIYVFDAEPRLSAGYTSETEALERRRAAELLQRARAEAGRPAAARWRGAPSVGRGLHELADQLGADVLVVGISRKAGLARLLRGDNARAALNGARCAVAVAPAGYARRVCAIERVGVCYDGSAEELARTGTDVDLLVVGSRGPGRLGRLLRPSRYRSLAGAIQCPLLIVPREADLSG